MFAFGKALRFLFVLICYWNHAAVRILAYGKPAFCEKNGDPFSFLWKIKRDPPSYLFGTIHVPYTQVWDHIPSNVKQAFQHSSQIFFELDLINVTTISAMSSCQMLPQGKNLSDILPSEMYTRLKRHLEYVRGMMPRWMAIGQRGRGLYADYLFNAIAGNWERKRPVWVMLMVNSLTESDIRSRGVPVLDLYLAQEAERLGKKTAAVEKVDEQCLPLNGLNVSQVLFALNHTLLQYELHDTEIHPSYTTDDLIRHYNCGDLDSVVFVQDTAPVPALSNSSLSSEEEAALARNIDLYFRQELIYNRNKRMGGRVVQLMQQNPDRSLFFAFGAGHFLGNDTILDFIQEHGFEIEHVSVKTEILESKHTNEKSLLTRNTVRRISDSIPEKVKRRKMNVDYRQASLAYSTSSPVEFEHDSVASAGIHHRSKIRDKLKYPDQSHKMKSEQLPNNIISAIPTHPETSHLENFHELSFIISSTTRLFVSIKVLLVSAFFCICYGYDTYATIANENMLTGVT